MKAAVLTTCVAAVYLLCGCSAQRQQFPYEQKPYLNGNQQKPYVLGSSQNQQKPYLLGNQNLFIRPAIGNIFFFFHFNTNVDLCKLRGAM